MEEFRLCNSDYRFMMLVWEHAPIGSGELVKLCAEKLGWKKSTTYTEIKRLCEKGVLQNEHAVVTPLVTQEEVQAKESDEFVERTFSGSLPGFLTAFLGNKKLSGKEAEELKKLIDENYLYTDDLKEEDQENGLYRGYINALGDPYSVYYDEEQTKSLQESTSGEYSGIGVVFSQNQETKVITAVQVYENSPANEAGIQVNDILYKVGDKDVSGTDLSDVVQLIRGVENTTVDITVLRGDDAKEVTMTVTRRKIQVETVKSEMKDDQIGYIRVTEFDSVTYDQFKSALGSLEDQGMKGLVVDLRANPGGNLATVTQMLDLLLPKGTIVSTKDKSGHEEVISSDDEHQFTKPMSVVVDGNSASASEIFAGAIQDYGLGSIVGTTTYGKGIVQQIFDLGDGTCVKLTMAEYYTPNGRNIHKKGITPDVEVEYQRDENNPNADNQLDAALEQVRNKINQ